MTDEQSMRGELITIVAAAIRNNDLRCGRDIDGWANYNLRAIEVLGAIRDYEKANA